MTVTGKGNYKEEAAAVVAEKAAPVVSALPSKGKGKDKGKGKGKGKGKKDAEEAVVVEEAPAVPALQWDEPELPSIDDFAKEHNKYDHCIVTVYQIVRDLHLKQEVVDITMVDGSEWGQNQYFIEARIRMTGKLRLMAPFHLDAEIDLPWLRNLALSCDKKESELFLCIHTPESIIYELISTELP